MAAWPLDSSLATREDIPRRIGAFILTPDAEGRYRVNKCYCHDSTWQGTLEALIECTDVVLMDLRGFQLQNSGCRFELAALAGAARDLRVVVLTDAATDQDAIGQAIAGGRTDRFVWLRVESAPQVEPRSGASGRSSMSFRIQRGLFETRKGNWRSSMRNLLLVAAFAANTALIASAQGVPGERFENWIFSAPQGWDKREDADGLRLTSPDGQATMRLLPGEELSSIGLKSWLDGQLVLLEQDLTLQTAEDPQSTPTSDHYEWLVWARGLRNRQGPVLPRSYLAADPRGRAELLLFTALTAEAFQRYLPALGQFIDSVKFANVLGVPKLPPRTLPAIPVPSAADLSSLGLTAERLKIEPIPDEFHCYFRRASDDYSSPDFLLQILSGRQYRTAAGTGSFTVAAQPESGQIQWRSGPSPLLRGR